MQGRYRVAGLVFVGLVLMVRLAAGQARTGELKSSLSGTIAPGYSASFGNTTGSTHNWGVGGTADYAGSFHNPNFLTFNANVYLNQSRSNSNFQSISNASGFNLSSSVFGGSRFPGAISYSKAYNSEGNYAIPGVANYVTHGNSDSLGITWSENLPDAPSLSAGFQLGTSKYSVYGADGQGANAFHSFNLHSGYKIAGFNMGAFYVDGTSHATIPAVITGQTQTQTKANNNGYGFNFMHALPLQGSVSGSVNRSGWNSSYLGYESNGNIDLFNAVATVHPLTPFAMTASVSYSDNLSGQLYQQIAAGGGVIPGLNTDQASNALDLMGVAAYNPGSSVQTTAFAERRTQGFLGQQYGANAYGGSVSYAHTLRVGGVSASLTMTDNTADKSDANTLGFSTTENYSAAIGGWNVSGSFGYAQNVQTLLVTYMNSSYHFTGNARRNWGKLFGSGGASISRTALTQNSATSSGSQGYNSSLGYGRYLTATATYSKSDGQALATGAGLVPVIPPILPLDLIQFGGRSYAFGVSSTPAKKLTLSAAYASSTSNTSTMASGSAVASQNQNQQFNALVRYQFRKMNFDSGFDRLVQGFSGSGVPAQSISSYSVGVSRWFKFF